MRNFKFKKIDTDVKTNGWLDVIFENNCKALIRTNDYIKNIDDYGNLEMLKETLALATLISKAPEMLEFLQDLSNAQKDLNPVYWIEKAQQLIKQATEI